MFKLKNKYRLQWIFIICFISSLKVINAQVTLVCTPQYPSFHETSDIGTSVTDCTVTGGDTVKIKSQTPSSSFIVTKDPDNPTVFGLYFVIAPDFETTTSYLVTLVGSQDTTESSPVDLTVLIVDDDDNWPYFNLTSTTFPVDENTKDVDVTQFGVKDADGSTDFDYTSITLSFLDSNDYSGTFGLSPITLDPQSLQALASLQLLKELDYENMVSYSLTITATDGGGLTTNVGMVVNVNDVEDSPPYFTHTTTFKQLSEDTAPGTTVFYVTAIDGDRGIAHGVTYAITSGDDNGDFDIDSTSGVVTVKNALDRDAGTTLYVLTIQATEDDVTDETVPYQTDTDSTISLTDVNDCAPVFSASTYTASVPENSVTNFLVTFDAGQSFVVTDADSDVNAVFDVTLSDPSNSFKINPTSGTSQQTFTIMVNDKANLDYESVPSLDVTVTAVDRGDATLTSTATVTITITDTNDTPPTINAITCDPTPEDAVVTTQLCTVDASNSDPTFATLSYSGNFGQLDGKIDIDPATGIITVIAADAFDYEYVQSYTFTVYVSNEDGAGMSVHSNGQLTITDVNDNAPTFQPSTYQATLNEDDADFAVPLIVQATDLDSDVNAQLTFSITDGSEYFQLGDVTPNNKVYSQTIVPIVPLDYETVSGCTSTDGCPITITVVATDGGTPALTSSATVTVKLMDTNDNAPEFSEDSYSGSVSEESIAGDSVTTVSATDADLTTKYSTFTYRLENDGAANFVIGATSGAITVAANPRLDPNIYSPVKYSYNLTAYANDGAHETSCSVIVSVEDVDNNPPVFDNQGIFSTDFNENDTSYISTPFYNVTATDEDSAPNLVYSIDFATSVARDSLGHLLVVDLSLWFTIDPATGGLLVVQAIDREAFDSADLALVVTDANTAEGADSDTGSIMIQINDVNDNPPVFQYPEYEASVPEGSINTIVTMAAAILATDQDRDFNQVAYSLDDTTYFQIAAQTGIISTTTTALDYEETEYVLLTITATDNGVPALSGTATINITVIDINDNPPTFDGPQTFSFNEDSTGVPGTMHATDLDSGDNGIVCYTFDPTTIADYGALFTITRDSGDINIVTSINYDISPNYDPATKTCPYVLTVIATDNCNGGSGKQYTDSTTATVNILPTNDFAPAIDTIDCPPVNEDEQPGYVIATVTAIDADKGPDGTPFHFTLADDSGHFKIAEDTGVVTLVNNVTDIIDTFSVTVTVCDDSPTQKCTDQEFSIEISDVNNHAPIIDSDVQGLIQPQTAWNCSSPEDLVVTVTYHDDDTDPINKDSTFSSTCKCVNNPDPSLNSAFAIDPVSGDLTINTELNETLCQEYQVAVTVTNVEDASETSTTLFNIEVNSCDYTNSPPVFNTSRSESVTWMESCSSTCASFSYPKPVELDKDEKNLTIYCYITDGNIDGTFKIDPEECVISIDDAGKHLDFETYRSYQLVLFASENTEPPVEPIPFDPKNPSLAVLNVVVGDVNDNAPYFYPDPFYSGVSSANLIGEVIATLTAYDPDTVDANQLTYSNGQVTVKNTKKMENVPNDCIIVNPNGEITLNYAFTDSMTGYIQFVATVKDSGELYSNTTDVKIYVVSSDEKLVCYASKTVGEFQNVTRDFEKEFSDTTGYNVVVDGVQPHTDAQDNAIPNQCEVIIHMADTENNILSADEAMSVVNDNNEELYSGVFIDFGVFQIQALVQPVPAVENNTTEYILIAVAAVLGVLSIALIILSIFNSRRMKRKLKAATAPAFVSQNSGMNRVGVPNSNLHAIEGSNPIWNQKTNMEQNLDETSDNVSIISLDVRDDKKFDGGLNNPTFEQRIENFFNEDNTFGDKNSLNSEKSDFDYEDRNSIRDDRNSNRDDRNSIRDDGNFILGNRDSSLQRDRDSIREDRNSFQEDRNNTFDDDRNSYNTSLRNELI